MGKSGRVIRAATFFVGVIVLWELATRLLRVPDWLVPAPSQVAATIAAKHWDMLFHAAVTLEATVLGFLLALVVGVLVGIGIIHSPFLRDTLYPMLIMSNSFPKVAIAPLFVIWIGVGIEAKIANAALLALFPIVINTILGLTDVDPELLEMVSAMSSRRRVLFWKVRLPHSLPYVFAGCKIAISLAVIGAVVGEFMSGRSGLGYLVLAANNYFNTPMAFAALVYLVVISLGLYWLVGRAERLMVPWYQRPL